MYRYPTHYYPYYYYPMYKYASLYDKLAPALPYLGAAGVGAGLGAVGGAGIGALRGGDWKKALKSALIGMVTGAVVGPAAYAGYRALSSNTTPPPPQETSVLDALYMIERDPELKADWERWGRPYDVESLQALLGYHGKNVRIRHLTW